MKKEESSEEATSEADEPGVKTARVKEEDEEYEPTPDWDAVYDGAADSWAG